jgi:RNA-directed DNA polymerase
MYQGEVQETVTGTPQGGIVSPLLANVYLHELDRYMESNYLNLSRPQRYRRRGKGLSNFLYVRYADDFVVLCNGTKAQASAMKEELKDVLNHMGLKLSEEKTRITHITEGFTFLGYKVIRAVGTRGKMVTKVHIPEDATKRFTHAIRRILAPNTTTEATTAKIAALNRLTMGWCQYYRNTSSPTKIFGDLSHELIWDMTHWLGKKYQLSGPSVMRKYTREDGSIMTLGTNSALLVLPNRYKSRKLLNRTWHNPYTEKEEIVREKILWYENLWLGDEHRLGWGDLREEVMLRKGTTCYVCGRNLHPSEVEMDHFDKPRAAFKDKTEADRMKHLQPICTSCHRAKTKTDLKVLSRMR